MIETLGIAYISNDVQCLKGYYYTSCQYGGTSQSQISAKHYSCKDELNLVQLVQVWVKQLRDDDD